MIIWINGSFGVGKTTISNELHKRLKDSFIYDPELINDGISIYHYILVAEKSTILNRLIKRGEVDNSWAAQQVDRCLTAFEKDIIGIKINTNSLNIEEIVKFILEKIY